MVEWVDEYKQYSIAIKDFQLRNAFNNLAKAGRWVEANIISTNMLKALPENKEIAKLDKFVKKKL